MATDAAPETNAQPAAKAPRSAGAKPRPKRKTRRPPGAPRIDNRPPRFDVAELAVLAGPPLWQSVHDAQVTDVTDVAVFVEVRPRGHEPLRAAVPRDELTGDAPASGAMLRVRLGDPPKAAEGEAPVPTASVRQAAELDALERLLGAREKSEPVPGLVVREVKGGYAVALGVESEEQLAAGGVLRAFLPRSQATYPRAATHEDVLGIADQFDVQELEPERANVVVSRRSRLRAEYKQKAKETWDSLAEGQVCSATVRAIMPYGAFVEVGGVDGLLHVSDLSWDRQPKVSDVLKVGQTLDVKVIKLDKEHKKLKVGVKQLQPDPWEDARPLLVPNTVVEGDVVAITDFGVFVRVAEGVEGLAHLSELTWDRIKHPSHRFKIGQRVSAKILEVDVAGRRLSLSTRALEQNPFEVIREQFPEGTVVKAKVKSLTDFGAFVELSESVDGMIHIGELSWTDHVNHPSEVLTLGQEVECVVMSVDVQKQRVACSIKRLTENPWDRWERQFQRGSRHKLTVSRVVDHGVFFQLDAGLTGFCPTRELSSEPVGRAQEMAKTGDELEVEVRTFDRKNRRVTLSAKAVVEGETREAYAEYKKREEGGGGRLTLGDALKGKLAELQAASGDDETSPPEGDE